MHVSLDGASAPAYESIRIKARFDKVLRNLRRQQKAKAVANSTLPHIRLVAVVMRQNLEELPALVRLACQEGIEHLAVQHLCHDFGEAGLPAQYHWRGSYISYDGKAMPCCMVSTPDRINFGDMPSEGVAAVWNNAAYAHFRARLSSESPPDVCRSCSVYSGTF